MPTTTDDAPAQDARGLFIVRNARAGTAVLRVPADLSASFPGARVHELADDEDMAGVVEREMTGAAPPAVLGVYGGDGSVALMADLARRWERPLLVLPGGTYNHFARSVGVADVSVAATAWADGATRSVSALEVVTDDGRRRLVLNAVSVGAYPELIDERERRRAQLGKWLGAVVAAWRALHEADPLVVVHDARRARVWSVFVGAGRNDPRRVATMRRESPTDPVLDIRIHHARGSRLRAVAALAFGRRTAAVLRVLGLMPPRTDVERLIRGEFDLTVRPGAGHPSVFVHDGEIEPQPDGGFTLRCRAVPDAVTVFAPAPGAH